MTRTPPPDARLLLSTLIGTHPYRDSILGDLEEQYAERLESTGEAAARQWYRREVVRSIIPFVAMRGAACRSALRVVAAVLAAYAGTLGLIAALVPPLERIAAVRGAPPFGLGYLVLLTIIGAMAGYAAARFAAKDARLGAQILLIVTLAIGAGHVAKGAPSERWLRAVKVIMLATAFAAGAAAASRRHRSSSLPRTGSIR
ncbi:MAG TPA: permease prefix domain 2-containing transporter [Gemmatimonadales bacterium]